MSLMFEVLSVGSGTQERSGLGMGVALGSLRWMGRQDSCVLPQLSWGLHHVPTFSVPQFSLYLYHEGRI